MVGWKLQVHLAQALRRWALTRCAWCGGRSVKGDPVNVSHQWDGPRGRWWRGEPGLFHHDCSTVEHAHRMCLCAVPVIAYGRDYGTCLVCGKFRAWRQTFGAAERLLVGLPAGSRIPPGMKAKLDVIYGARRAAKRAAEAKAGEESGE